MPAHHARKLSAFDTAPPDSCIFVQSFCACTLPRLQPHRPCFNPAVRHRSARPLVRPASFAAHVAVPAPAPDLFTALPLPPPTPVWAAEAAAPAAPTSPTAPTAPPALAAPVAPTQPEDLHPALWRAHQLARPREAVLASDYAELDAQLPGGGWPVGVLTELLLPHPGVGELRLLAPVLAAVQEQQRGVMWFDPPALPCAWALLALGIDVRRLVVVTAKASAAGRTRGPQQVADMLWALEQTLKSGHLGAVLAWLPARLPADALRRLQLAAQAHEGPVFLLRGEQERSRASAAPLRLLLGSAGPDLLRVALLKRRGPPLAAPLTLALAPVLSPPALARALQGAAARPLPALALAPAWAHSGFAAGSSTIPTISQGPP